MASPTQLRKLEPRERRRCKTCKAWLWLVETRGERGQSCLTWVHAELPLGVHVPDPE